MDSNLPTTPVEPIKTETPTNENSVLDPVTIDEPQVTIDKSEAEVPVKHKIIVTALAFLAVFLLALLVGVWSILR